MFERGVVVVQWDSLNNGNERGPRVTVCTVETDDGAIFAKLEAETQVLPLRDCGGLWIVKGGEG